MAEPRSLPQLKDAATRLAFAGMPPGDRDPAAVAVVHGLVQEAHDLGKAETAAAARRDLARAWSAYLELLLANRDLVLDIRYGEPALWARLCDALLGEPRG